MSGVPVAIPLAWTWCRWFFLQKRMMSSAIGSDCLRHRGFIR